MEGSSFGKPKSITEKKKGGFLFASVPEKTEENLLQERIQKEQQEATVKGESIEGFSSPEATNPPIASHPSTSEHSRLIASLEAWNMSSPHKVPLHGDRATASSLRERLRQYQTLKAEQLNQPMSVSDEPTPAAPAALDAPDDDTNSFLGPPTTASAIAARELLVEEGVQATPAENPEDLDESWVPPPPGEEEADITVEEIVEYPDEGYDEEEVVDQDEDDDEQEEDEEIVEEEYVSESALVAAVDGAGASSVDLDEDQGVFRALEKEEPVEAADLDLNDDQDVFRLLDNAERADGVGRSIPIEQEVAPVEAESVSKSRTPPGPYVAPGHKQNLILCAIFVVFVMAVVAIVLPFVINDGNDDTNTSGVTPTTAPAPTVGPPTLIPGPSVPTAPSEPPGPTEPTAPTPTPPTATTPPPGEVPTQEPTETSAPTGTPTSQRFGQLVSQFLIPISGEDVFLDSTSPQFRAAVYISDIDPYTSQLTSVEELEDRYASITFYFATDGDNWGQCSLTDESCTTGRWLVDNVCGWFAVSCNADGRISSYNFDGDNGLQGTLPLETFLLRDMTDFIIVNNTISGTLPELFGENATSVRSFVLEGNTMTGTVPDDYLANSPLEVMNLADNGFTGAIPTSLGNGTLTQLDLSGNSFSGPIPIEIAFYDSLQELLLSSNALTGTISDGIYALETLQLLYLDGNPLSGTISSFIRNLGSLVELSLGDSEIGGFLPDELFTLINLVELDISGAAFQGPLSVGFLNLAGSLQRLLVGNNTLSGTVPSAFGSLTNLNVLELQANNFIGTMPTSVCDLRGVSLTVLTADCEELTCTCCTECFA